MNIYCAWSLIKGGSDQFVGCGLNANVSGKRLLYHTKAKRHIHVSRTFHVYNSWSKRIRSLDNHASYTVPFGTAVKPTINYSYMPLGPRAAIVRVIVNHEFLKKTNHSVGDVMSLPALI